MKYSGIIGNLELATDRAFRDLEYTTENITNLNTVGYKGKRLNDFEKVVKNMEAGNLKITKDKHDIALEGKGFFAVYGEDGEMLLTRTLNVHNDKDNNLVSDGKHLFPPGSNDAFTNRFSEFKIAKDGKVIGKRQEDGTEIPLGHLRVVNVPDANKLEHDGTHYHLTPEAGPVGDVALGQLHQTKVRQGTIEISNIDLPYEYSNFNVVNQKIRTLTSIFQLLNQSRRQYIQTLSQLAG